jgi:hypothetical protein
MVVGHTIQEDGKVMARCEGAKGPMILGIDLGMSKAYGTVGKGGIEILYRRGGVVDIRAVYMDHTTLISSTQH